MLHALTRPTARTTAVGLLAVVVAGGVIGVLAILGAEGIAQPALAGTSLRGRAAPDFRLADQFGRITSLSQFRGRPVVVTFLETNGREICPLIAASFLINRGGTVRVMHIGILSEGFLTHHITPLLQAQAHG
jgi:cytochrome oxidase Cu insertion factor (SCO1/SenC/PrrC family)